MKMLTMTVLEEIIEVIPLHNYLTILLLFLLFPSHVLAVGDLAESRRAEVDELNKVSWNLKDSAPDSALALAQQAWNLATELNYPNGMALAQSRMAKIAKMRGNPEKALSHYRINLLIRINSKDETGIASTYLNMASVFKRMGQSSKALKFYYKSLDIFDSLDSTKQIAKVHNNIGTIHLQDRNFEKAEEHFQLGLELRLKLNNPVELARSYQNMGKLFAELEKFPTALELFRKGLLIYREYGNRRSLGSILNSIGGIFFETNQLDSAVHYFSQTHQHYKALGNREGLSALYNNIGEAKVGLGQLDSAQFYYRASQHLAVEIGNPVIEMKAIGGLIDVFDSLGEIDSAYDALIYWAALRDTVFNAEKSERIEALQKEYEVGQARLKTEKIQGKADRAASQRNAILLGGIILLLAIAFLAYALFQRLRHTRMLAYRREAENKQEILQIMKSQEVKTLNAMVEGQETERERIAQDLHDRLGSLLATVKMYFGGVEEEIERAGPVPKEKFERADRLLDEACVEVRQIAHDMAAGVLSDFGLNAALNELTQTLEKSGQMKIDYHQYGLQNRLDRRLEIEMFRIVQELLSNVIRHAEARHVTVQLTLRDDALSLLLEDDGKGFKLDQNPMGMGLRNIANRVEDLKGQLNIDAKPGRGTAVIVEVPVSHNQ